MHCSIVGVVQWIPFRITTRCRAVQADFSVLQKMDSLRLLSVKPDVLCSI